MPIGDPITQPIPPVGTSGTQYATEVNEFLEEVKERLEDQIPVSALLPGPLDMLNNPIDNVQYVHLYEQGVTPVTPSGSLQRFNGDLWWISLSGAVQITDGAAVNS